MARRRFFVPQIRLGQAELLGDDAQHLTRVLRVEPGQRYEISDNRQAYLAEVTVARKSQVVFQVLEPVPLRPLPVRITIAAALVKFDRLEWMLEKATELGVERVALFASERSDTGLDRAAVKRLERWRKIVLESSQQCRRDTLPQVDGPVEWDEALTIQADTRLLLDETPGAPPLLSLLPTQQPLTPQHHVALLLGPEGGWTPFERQTAITQGWQSTSLGGLVLRAETAAISALAVLSSVWSEAAAAIKPDSSD